MFYLVCKDLNQRTKLIEELKRFGVSSVFHYLSLHKSDFYKKKNGDVLCPNSDRYTECLVRLPMYFEINECQQKR